MRLLHHEELCLHVYSTTELSSLVAVIFPILKRFSFAISINAMFIDDYRNRNISDFFGCRGMHIEVLLIISWRAQGLRCLTSFYDDDGRHTPRMPLFAAMVWQISISKISTLEQMPNLNKVTNGAHIGGAGWSRRASVLEFLSLAVEFHAARCYIYAAPPTIII